MRVVEGKGSIFKMIRLGWGGVVERGFGFA